MKNITYKEGQLKKYLDRLAVIIGSIEMLIGKGLNVSLEILSKLTDKICNGSKSKKLCNQIVILLDMLLKDG